MSEESIEQIIDRYCRDWREREVLTEYFVAGLKPQAIYARRPEQFQAVADVYRIIENFQVRMRRGSGPTAQPVG